jgi:hypothetical protein
MVSALPLHHMQNPLKIDPLARTLFIAMMALHSTGCPAAQMTLSIDPNKVVEEADPHRLTGTNVSLWSRRPIMENQAFQQAIRDWHPGSIRIPGGSWSNEYYWNGNGVRIGNGHSIENFDTTKQRADGTWEVDYSDYKPGFRLHGEARHLSDYHGDLDVKVQHDWIRSLGTEAMVTVNVGSGTPEVAAEWVKWANEKQGYGVRLWEVGNELNGDWELGHRLPDGSSMTGMVYAQLFKEFAAAMHAVDPNIKLGGPACSDLALDFVEELIRDGGDALDFVSLHAYPVGVNTKNSADKFAAIHDLRDAIHRIDTWIKKYQPERVDEIEIGVTEWNIKVNEDRDTAELISALWSALWIGAMFEEGVDFANQWDLTTYTSEGGHSAFNIDESTMTVKPKAQYWALWMWSNLMGDQMVSSQLQGNRAVKSFVTRNEEGLQVMLVNTSEDDEFSLRLKLQGSAITRGILHTYSSAEYFWDPHAKKPLWSRPPSTRIHEGDTVTLPEFSISILQIPADAFGLTSNSPQQSTEAPALQLLLPERVPSDRPIEGWVVAHNPKEKLPHLGTLAPIKLHVEGPAKLSRQSLSLTHGTAHFEIIPTGAGKITVTAKSGKLKDHHSLQLVALSERPYVQWTFDNPIPEWHVKSTFEIGSESSVKPNQYVAASRLLGETPSRDADVLFHFGQLPREKLQFENASGVIGHLRASHDLKCADANARVNVILQSDANHWMPIGTVALSDIIGRWSHFEFKFTDPEKLDAMAKLYSIRFQIQSDTPVTGDIYLDDLGFIFRTGL